MLERRDELDLFRDLARTRGPALIVLHKPGCGACRRLLGLLEREHHDLLGPGQPSLRTILVDAEDSPGIVEDYEVFHLPALLLWLDGEFHARVEAELTPASLRRALLAALAGPPQPEP